MRNKLCHAAKQLKKKTLVSVALLMVLSMQEKYFSYHYQEGELIFYT